jgi:hypothetical protein
MIARLDAPSGAVERGRRARHSWYYRAPFEQRQSDTAPVRNTRATRSTPRLPGRRIRRMKQVESVAIDRAPGSSGGREQAAEAGLHCDLPVGDSSPSRIREAPRLFRCSAVERKLTCRSSAVGAGNPARGSAAAPQGSP